MFCFTVSLGQPPAFLTPVLCSHPHGKNPFGCRETATPKVPWHVAAQSLGAQSLPGQWNPLRSREDGKPKKMGSAPHLADPGARGIFCSEKRRYGFTVHKAEPLPRLPGPLREPLAPAAGNVVPRLAGAACWHCAWQLWECLREGGREEKQVSSLRETGDREGSLNARPG